MFRANLQLLMALRGSISHQHRICVLNLFHLKRPVPVCCSIHGTKVCRKADSEISSEPVKFTSSPANMPSKLKIKDVNQYQPLIVVLSLMVFMVYFFYLREENDIDELLNSHLFDQVPALEEPHLAQAIPIMKKQGLDTTETEARLKELVKKRLDAEKLQK